MEVQPITSTSTTLRKSDCGTVEIIGGTVNVVSCGTY